MRDQLVRIYSSYRPNHRLSCSHLYRHLYILPLSLYRCIYDLSVLFVLKHFVQQANTYIIVLLSLDRYIQVRHSAAVSLKWSTQNRAIVIVCAAIGFSIVYNIPRFLEYVPLIINYQISIDRCYGYFLFSKLNHWVCYCSC